MIENWFQLLHADLFLRVRRSLHILQALKSLVSQTESDELLLLFALYVDIN